MFNLLDFVVDRFLPQFTAASLCSIFVYLVNCLIKKKFFFVSLTTLLWTEVNFSQVLFKSIASAVQYYAGLTDIRVKFPCTLVKIILSVVW